MSHFSLRESLPKRKISPQTWISINVFVANDYFMRKKFDNWNTLFGENNLRFFFSRHALLKSKIGLPNLDSSEFFCGKQLIHSKKTCKQVFLPHLKKIVWAVLDIFTSCLIFGMLYPTSSFPILSKILKPCLCFSLVLCVKFGVSIFISYDKPYLFWWMSNV